MEEVNSSDQSAKDLYSNKPVVHSDTLRTAMTQLLAMYVDEEHFYLGRDMGIEILNNVPDECQTADTPDSDICGNSLSKKNNFGCECPKCHRTVAESRFAAHLETCMGMGRNSSRIASRVVSAASGNSNNNNNNNATNISTSDSTKNASQGNPSGGQGPNALNGELGSESEDGHVKEDDDDDEDWSLDKKKKSKKGNSKLTVKRKDPLPRVKKAGGTAAGPKRRRGVSPPSPPASLRTVESSVQEEDAATHMMSNLVFLV